MDCLIRYCSANGNRYLCDDDTITKLSNGTPQHFSSLQQAQDYVLVHMQAIKLKNILQRRHKKNFEVINTENKIIGKLFDKNTKGKVKMAENDSTENEQNKLNKIFDDLRQHLGHALILDLEFYQSSNEENHQRMAQIAGTILGGTAKHTAFNGFVFDPTHMDNGQQIDFLKEHDLTYKQALQCNSHAIMAQVENFIKVNDIDTIISWGHNLDFNTLSNEGYSDIIPGQMNTLDLENVLDQINKKKDVSLNLANYCNMLNLTNDGKWHDALDDARMIKKICTLYLNVLTQPLEKKHEAETIDRSLIYSVDTSNEEPEKETLPTNAIVLD